MGNGLRPGYTTGTCAAIAAKAAAVMALGGNAVYSEKITIPKGVCICAEIEDIRIESRHTEDKNLFSASCAVRKDAGDDPDITNGILVYAKVTLTDDSKIFVDGGEGVGRITKPGLSQGIGEAAINPVPKRMIHDEVKSVLEQYGYEGGATVIISVPGGEELAKATFNPRLGIEGGISILGTTGMVEPMSQQALIDTIKVELDVARANGTDIIVMTPGNYGEEFVKNNLHIDLTKTVKCSNFIGESIDYAVGLGFKGIMLVGHIGKFIKLAAGIMNTHSKQADARMEIFAAYAALSKAPHEVIVRIMECISTDEAVRILDESGYLKETMDRIVERIAYHTGRRINGAMPFGVILFSNENKMLWMTEDTKRLLSIMRSDK